MKKKPIVSIVLPVHNSERYLSDCVRSLIRQKEKKFEIVAIDDFSTDNSYKILKQIAKRHKKLRIYRNVKRYGIGITLNRALRKTKGQFVAFMSSNDIATPLRIKKQLKYLIENPQVVACGTQVRFINKDNKKLGRSNFPHDNQFIYQSPLHGISMQFETVMINKILLPKDVLKFTTSSSPFLYSDGLIKLLPYGKFANLKEYLQFRRENPKAYFSDLRKNILSFIRLWFTSKANYNYNAPLSSLFAPFIKTQTAK